MNKRSITTAQAMSIWMVVGFLFLCLVAYLFGDTGVTLENGLVHRMAESPSAMLLLVSGPLLMIWLYLRGRWITWREFNKRDRDSQDITHTYEALDALEYLSRVGTNHSGWVLAEIKSNVGSTATSSEDNVSISELLFKYKSILLDEKRDELSPHLVPESSGNLLIIHNYLSMHIWVHPTEVTIETAKEALSEPVMRHGVGKYVAGAIYFLFAVVAIHAYMTVLQNSSDNLTTYYNKYDSVVHRFKADTASNPIGQAALYANIASLVKNAPADSIPKRIQATMREFWQTRSRQENRRDSTKLLALELHAKLDHLHNRLQSYPMFAEFSSEQKELMEKDSSYSHSLLTTGLYYRDVADNLTRNIKSFILPMLYGLLGAYLYVIRRLSMEIKNLDFTWKKSMRNEARLILGLFVGMFFGYLFRTPSLESLVGVTTYVMAFIGGYQVEILFSAMDTIVKKFVGEADQPGARPATALPARPPQPQPQPQPSMPVAPATLSSSVAAGGTITAEGKVG